MRVFSVNSGRLSQGLGNRIGGGALAALLAAAGVVVLGASPVTAAAGDPTFETPTGNPGTVGSVGFFNASGVQIYSGTVSADPIAAYFQAQGGTANGGPIKAGDHVATAYSYAPQDNKPADQWTTPYQLTAGDESGTAADSASYPGTLKNSTRFIAVGVGGGLSINDAVATFPLASTNDPGILQLRVLTDGDASHYYSTDIKITGSSWAQVFPAPPVTATATSTTLSATPNPSTVGQSVTFAAVATGADSSHPAGTVQFKDGSANLGAPITVNAGGSASLSNSALAQGTHSVTAVFTPSGTGYTGSTSAAVSQLVNSVPTATVTQTVLTVSPSSPVTTPTVSTLSATVTPAGATGTVQFLDGSASIGAPVQLSGGTAQTSTTLAVGSHSLTARFVPTDSTAFTGSVSPASTYLVNPLPAQTTSTSINVSPAGPVTAGDLVTVTATVVPATAPGAFQFYDGSTPIGMPAGSSSAGAQWVTSSLSVGSHTLSAKFLPTNPTDFGSSTANPVTLVVKPAPVATGTSVSISPTAKAIEGSSLTYRASLSPAAAAGSVQFAEDGLPIGSPVAVAGGAAALPATASGLGNHTITASFTPTDAANYVASSGSATLTVIAPATPTSTDLQVTPAGPVDFGTGVTLTATVPTTGATGSIRFLDGTVLLNTVALTGGSANLTTTALASGSHSLSATYLPADTDLFTGSNSATTTLVVNPQASSTTLSSTPAGLVSQGSPVHLTASLAPGTATGTVQFLDGALPLGTAPVTGGSASITASDLIVGDHQLSAVFTPTNVAAYGGSTSGAVKLTVKPAATVDAVTVGGKQVSTGETLRPGDEVTVSGAGFVPNETVQVVLDKTVLATATASATGEVSTSVRLPATLSAGTHHLVLRGSLDVPAFAFAVDVVASSVPVPTSRESAGAGTASGGGPSLASTGAVIVPALGVALLMLLAGGLLLVSSRRRAH
ncbi:MAG: beta strand repeat-containing protein [Jatrophihabitans sp.]